MIQQLLSRIKHDDNPRLHHTPFIILWMASYGLGWVFLRTYEILWYQSGLCDFYLWLRGGYDRNPETWWREDIFVGLLFGLSLAVVQTWLIRRRYGYVPKFWRVATIIGSVIAGFGYPRLGLFPYGIISSADISFDYLLWFSTINIFQSIVMWRINKTAWQIAGIGVLSSFVAISILHLLNPHSGGDTIALILGIAIQALGTALSVIKLMNEPREGIVPKRGKNKSKNNFQKKFHPITFIGLWLLICLMGHLTLDVIIEIRQILYQNFYNYREFISWTRGAGFSWILEINRFAFAGIIIGFGQQWLLKQQHRTIDYWTLVTTLSWLFAGYMLSNRIPNGFQPLYYAFYFTVPILLPSLLIMRRIYFGWILTLIGILAFSVLAISPTTQYYQSSRRLFVELSLSLITGIILLVISSWEQKRAQKVAPS